MRPSAMTSGVVTSRLRARSRCCRRPRTALMPLARWSPLAYAANFEPSGWKAATPEPADDDEQERPASTRAPPPQGRCRSRRRRRRSGSSQSAPRRSDQSAEQRLDHRATRRSRRASSTAASVYERSKRSTRRRAAAPAARRWRSRSRRWPAESAAIARLSSSARTGERIGERYAADWDGWRRYSSISACASSHWARASWTRFRSSAVAARARGRAAAGARRRARRSRSVERLDARAVTAPSKTGRPQVPQ